MRWECSNSVLGRDALVPRSPEYREASLDEECLISLPDWRMSRDWSALTGYVGKASGATRPIGARERRGWIQYVYILIPINSSYHMIMRS